MDRNLKMYGVTSGGALLKLHKRLELTAELVYEPSQWEPGFVTIRAGGLTPIARQYPGARKFVEAHRKEVPGGDLSYRDAMGYGGCQTCTGTRRVRGFTTYPLRSLTWSRSEIAPARAATGRRRGIVRSRFDGVHVALAPHTSVIRMNESRERSVWSMTVAFSHASLD